MALKNFRQPIVAFVAGLLLGPTVVWAGLESATYISDLVASNPLSSDLASTADDHIRLLKSTIKTTFPNINNAVTVTDEVLNGVPTGSANPTGTIGLSAVNGSATTYLRSDGAPALSQAIAPTWSDMHTFTRTRGAANQYAVLMSAAVPAIGWTQTGAAANNARWLQFVASEQWLFSTTLDNESSNATIMSVDRTGTTVDRVAFPTVSGYAHLVGVVPTAPSANTPILGVNSNAASSAAQFENTSATAPTVYIGSDQTGGNTYVHFYDGGDPDTTTGTITTNGTTTAYNTSSDAGLKKNFKPAPSARRVIDCIPIESYDWKQGGAHVDHGVVAQRLQKCAPYAVTPGDIWQVNHGALIPAMLKYIQEQDARITALERRLH